MSLELHAIEFSVGREAAGHGKEAKKAQSYAGFSKDPRPFAFSRGNPAIGFGGCGGEDSVGAFADGKFCCGGVRTGARI
jgi:hypothetical protein